jgi:hypothetical protein
LIAERPNLTPAEVRERAQAWFDRQVEVLSKAHGDSWPAHETWIKDYLREEIRQRLLALGWTRKR